MVKIFNKMCQIFINILVFIVTVLILLILYNSVMIKFFEKNIPMGFVCFEVASASMAPSINVNDLIVVRITDKIDTGDIITYVNNGDYITHRVTKIDDDIIYTKGDANNTDDPPIKKTQAIGKTIFHIPYLGKAILFVQSPIGLASVLAVLIGLKVMYSLIRTKQEDLEL